MKSLIFFVMGITICSAAIVPCPDTVAYSVYLGAVNNAGGCVIGDKLFSNFTYSVSTTGGATPVGAGDIIITTEGPAGSGATAVNPEYGFLFNALWFAGANQSIDSLVGYKVTVVLPNLQPGPALINDATLAMIGGHTGTGAAGVDELVCLGAALPPCPGGTVPLSVFSDGGTRPQDHQFFALQNMVGISKDIFVRGGPTGNANISGVLNTVSQVPEPMTMSLIGAGLLGFGILRRRLKN